MALKKISIPIAPHLKKFLDMEVKVSDGAYVINRKIIPPRFHNPRQYREYFKKPVRYYIYISVLTSDSKLYKLYSWVQTIDHLFTDRLIQYVSVRYTIMSSSEAVRQFLALYQITESEYAWETAYKKWQRSSAYKILKLKYPQHGNNKTYG